MKRDIELVRDMYLDAYENPVTLNPYFGAIHHAGLEARRCIRMKYGVQDLTEDMEKEAEELLDSAIKSLKEEK